MPAITATFIAKPGSSQCSRLRATIATYTRKVGVVKSFFNTEPSPAPLPFPPPMARWATAALGPYVKIAAPTSNMHIAAKDSELTTPDKNGMAKFPQLNVLVFRIVVPRSTAGRPRESTAPVQTSVRLTKKENTNVSNSTPLSSTPAKPLTIAAGSVMFIMTAERNRASCTRNSPALFNKYPPANTAR